MKILTQLSWIKIFMKTEKKKKKQVDFHQTGDFDENFYLLHSIYYIDQKDKTIEFQLLWLY